jgi:hypothetical protein
MDEESDRVFQADMKRQQGAYGPTAAPARIQYGSLPLGVLTPAAKPVTERIAELCKRVTDVSAFLASARTRHHETAACLQGAAAAYDNIAAELLHAIKEHRGEENVEIGTSLR